MQSFGANVIIVLLGDLNACVDDKLLEDLVSKHGMPGRNLNGERMIGICVERELVAGNILFKNKGIQRYTWMRQDNGRVIDRTMIDFVVVSRNIIGWLLYVRVLRKEGGGMSDHFLVEGKLKYEI